jgi:cysteinyl-tRNA synthetase
MITINGQKMGKSLGNALSLNDFFSGKHELLAQAYSPMTIRFFMLQAHYRSTLDFSNEALQAADKGLKRLLTAAHEVKQLQADDKAPAQNIGKLGEECYAALNDDLNSPIAIARLFDAVRLVNAVKDGHTRINKNDLSLLQELFQVFVFDILGLETETGGSDDYLLDGLMETIIQLRQDARQRKDYATSDLIRDKLAALQIVIKDGKEGTSWERK